MATLLDAARRLVTDVDGVDWNASAVQAAIAAVHDAARHASVESLNEALAVLVARLHAASVDDCDGVAHVALTCGTLVERGAGARSVATALLELLPHVLGAARRFADSCIAGADVESAWAGVDEASVVAEVDGCPITVQALRARLGSDRPGACALARLEQWVLPTVATLSREPGLLTMAASDPELQRLSLALRESSARWLRPLLATQLDAQWRVLEWRSRRGFLLGVDQVSRTFELHEGVEDVLSQVGLTRAPRDSSGLVRAAFDLVLPTSPSFERPPNDQVVWREGVPTDVPFSGAFRTVVAVPAAVARTWRTGRPFEAMTPRVWLIRELEPGEAVLGPS